MTKLMEWLIVAFLLFGSWIALITGNIHSPTSLKWYHYWFPIILLFLFGIYAALIVLYRVFTFNNCEDAAAELQKQIKEATQDLTNKGIKLKQHA
ncbi:dolichol-phosphate mannosyltransferase subunit 3 [Nasonia vitripennis]|uniref:Dolichol-phosphate mannosyltransferase subunit 3 n=1 Tax=Nasonia vitripennis TaxID=7425 RepID=A0A7M7GAS2_NASVI|nr:dolichol-phosphate mannosyltransferase subunit 3 [Nasonia vitripennis]